MPVQGNLTRGLGKVAAIALVTGNMIGSGIFVTPAALAGEAGPLSLVAWLINVLGYLCLTAVFADLGRAFPISGGLQAFSRRAFGKFAGMQVGYLYWLCAVIGNAAFLTAFTSYLVVFVPAAADPWVAFACSQALLWTLTFGHVVGVRVGGAVQIVTTVLKVVPLLVLSIALIPEFSLANLQPVAPHGAESLLPAVSLMSWMFIGMESITVPAEEIHDAGRTISRSIYIGFALTSAVYLLVLVTLMGAAPASQLAASAKPLADIAATTFGPAAAQWLSLGALISIVGILNGWLLVTSRMAHATARDGLAPRVFARLHPRTNTPIAALLVTSLCSGAIVSLYFSGAMLDVYNFISMLSTATALTAIGCACVAQLVLMRREPGKFVPGQHRRGRVTAVCGLLVVGLMIAGAGARVIGWTLACMAIPVPYYLWKIRDDGQPSPS